MTVTGGAVPRQIQQQEDEALKAFELLNSETSTKTTEEETVSTETPSGEEEETRVEPTAETPPAEEKKDDEGTWEQRYKTLQGMHKAELERTRKELQAQMTNDLVQFKQDVFSKLGTLAEKPAEETNQTSAKDAIIQKLVDDGYDKDYIDNMLELIRLESGTTAQETIKPVAEKITTVEETQTNAELSKFKTELTTQSEIDWEPLWNGQDPEFNEFLKQEHPAGMFTFGEILMAANQKWDAGNMAKVFNAYNATKAKPAQTQKPPASVSPARSTTTETPKADEPIYWTRETIKQFEKDDRAGKYTPEESQRLLDDLLMAPSQNRLR